MMKVPGSYSSLAAREGRRPRRPHRLLPARRRARWRRRARTSRSSSSASASRPPSPTIAATIKSRGRPAASRTSRVLSVHKTVPGALEALVNDPEVAIDGFILPGHVSTIIGPEPYRFLASNYHVPGVATGFEPIDVLQGVWMLVKQIHDGRAEIEIAYSRGVNADGNPTAQALIAEVFEPSDAEWRGIGVIPGTGLAHPRGVRGRSTPRSASTSRPPEPKEIPGCQCGDVLRGVVLPFQCRLFGKGCTPEHPIGPCMVSSEGSCAAYYRYTDYGRA